MVSTLEKAADPADVHREWAQFSAYLTAPSAFALTNIMFFAAMCLRPGCSLDSPNLAPEGLDEDAIVALGAQLKSFFYAVARQEGPHHNCWADLGVFAQACTAQVLKTLPDTDPRNGIFERTVGHSPRQFLDLYQGK